MPQRSDQREALRELLRRVDEVRSLSSRPPVITSNGADDAEILLATATELVDELERSHRQLIETNVQLVSLREVANSMVSSAGAEETTRTVATYLLKAFTFREVFLCLANPSEGYLEGTWAREDETGVTATHPIRISLIGEPGVVGRTVWQNRTITIQDPQFNAPFFVDSQNSLEPVLRELGSFTVVPLQRSRTPDRPDEAPDACPANCPFRPGSASDHIPAPGGEGGWEERRDIHRKRCLDCNRFPVLGIVGVGSVGPGPGLTPAEVTLLESVSLSVAPVLENAQLYQDLRKNQRFLDHILNSMSAGLLAVDLDGNFLIFNRAAEEMTGHQAGYVVGEPLDIIFPEDPRRLLHDTLESGRSFYRQETTLLRADGDELPISLTTSLLRNEGGQVYGAIAAISDLSRIKRMEEQIRQLDRLAALGRFTSSVAHEIRNPLAGIAAGVEYLGKGLSEKPELNEHLQFIENEIGRLDRIIADLFNVTHPQKLSPRRIEIVDLVERSLQSVQAVLDQKHIQFRLDHNEDVEAISLDPDQMQQVLINLIKNAAEASPEDSKIVMGVELVSANGDGVEALSGEKVIRISIQDEGPGIPADHLNRLFEPFFTTKSTGTGLGLYVSHDIVKRHGGSMRARSQMQGGARFEIELPLDPSQGGNHG